MSEVGSVNLGKFSKYDLKKIDNVAQAAISGDLSKAQMELDEFTKDKKADKIRNFVISAGVLAGAIASRKFIAGKITDFAEVAGNVVGGWFKKGEGKRVVTEFFDKDINIKKGVKKAINTVFKDEEYATKVTQFVKKYADKFNLNISKMKDVVSLGIATVMGVTLDNPVNKVMDKADEAFDADRNNEW